jgi:cyclopropane-fatty-acyl-phospholipid synthase
MKLETPTASQSEPSRSATEAIDAGSLADDRHSTEAPPARRSAPPTELEKRLLRSLLDAAGAPPVRIILWNGDEVSSSRGPIVGAIVIRDRSTLFKLAVNPNVVFGDAYAAGRIDVRGPLVDVLCALTEAQSQGEPQGWLRRLLPRPRRRRRSHSLSASRDSVHHHYDIGNDFYRLWLDEQLLYTCAYYADPQMTLEQAQIAKMDHVCRKLRLRRGERVVEAGCGWGALALFMAEKYGVTVRAYNLSREQVRYARDRALAQRLSQRVEFVEDDYRAITGRYDVFVSVGMLEHVGLENYGELGRVIDGALTQDGRGLIHSIGRNAPRPLDGWIDKRIFPGAYPPALSEMMRIFEPWRLSVLDIENIRLHYARTLEHWLERYERSLDQVRRMFDERFVRTWRLYLAGSIAAFRTGSLQLFQVVFSRERNNNIPWTRAPLYVSSGDG